MNKNEYRYVPLVKCFVLLIFDMGQNRELDRMCPVKQLLMTEKYHVYVM